MSKKRKALVALIAPAFVALYPFFVGGWDWKLDFGPAVVALLVAYGVYRVPNAGSTSSRRAHS
jgi:hypothetical protein